MQRYDRSAHGRAKKLMEERQAREGDLSGSTLSAISPSLNIATKPMAHGEPSPEGYFTVTVLFDMNSSSVSDVAELPAPIRHITELEYLGGFVRSASNSSSLYFFKLTSEGGMPLVNASICSTLMTPNSEVFPSGALSFSNSSAFVPFPLTIGRYPKGDGVMHRMKLETFRHDTAASTPTITADSFVLVFRVKTLAPF
jgi:hypothetical protein